MVLSQLRAQVTDLLHEFSSVLNEIGVGLHEHIDGILIALDALGTARATREEYIDERADESA